ncbi:hypothetical protein NIES2119_26765 [[Phormidium ambiguum] IAM M-71]|uniref:Bacterial OB-fold domain-containing protein n=1 Tax=[Phormidium ambiguum] IAM M-71 TaxID=454136 RepID=A0A1U7I7E7_9CYAN|nr:hypothetical protein [Phormidium ambiguum]OKH32280.1 hypothetical protein NIES2119_26765 [Phormidium ambiguum IAM M-71]
MKKIVFGIVALTGVLGAASIAIAQNEIRYPHNNNNMTITGKIVQIGDEKFLLESGTEQFLIDADNLNLRTANLREGETVTVNIKSDDDDFEAISITRDNRKVIYIFDD